MKICNLVFSALAAILACLVTQSDAISLGAFLLLHQQALANHRRQQQLLATQQPPTSWAKWGMWSTCTSSVRTGVRVRSRQCNSDAATCDTLNGDNYQVESCTHKATEAHKRDSEFVRQCRDDIEMRDSMSCRLYMENSTLAYDIYVTMGCIMSVLDDSNYEGEDESKFVFGRRPVQRSGETSPVFSTIMETEPLTSGRMSSNQNTPRQGDGAQANGGGTLSNAVTGLVTNRVCVDSCNDVISQATGIRNLLLNPPRTVDGVLALLHSNIIMGSASAISRENAQCIAECQLFGPPYALARRQLASRGLDLSQQDNALRVAPTVRAPRPPPITGRRRRRSILVPRAGFLNRQRWLSLRARLANARRMGTRPTLRPRTTEPVHAKKPVGVKTVPTMASVVNATEAQRVKAPAKRPKPAHMPQRTLLTHGHEHRHNITAILVRGKRQAPISPSSYTNPCVAEEEVSRNPRVVAMDDTKGELFFFERRRQRFLRRSCAGTPVVTGSLYLPKETVTQDRTKQRAICKQAFLPRFGLMIFFDDQGEYAFQDGRRFSVKLRQFKLESNCELSVPV